MVTVIPGQTVEQRAGETVVYELAKDLWGRGDGGELLVETIRGVALEAKQVFHDQKVAHIVVSGGQAGGKYEIVRQVSAKNETERKSFRVRVIG
jgi:hypothetical protein